MLKWNSPNEDNLMLITVLFIFRPSLTGEKERVVKNYNSEL